MSDATVLDRLYEVILSRRGADPERSHTARLFQKGTPKIAQKLGEEAVETVIASGGAGGLHHMVEVLAETGVSAVLAASIFHFGQHGIGEAKRAIAAAGLPVRLGR